MFFFFQAEDGIRDLVRSRGLGDVYKRQVIAGAFILFWKRTGIDITLGNDFRRAVDEIHAKSLSLIHI